MVSKAFVTNYLWQQMEEGVRNDSLSSILAARREPVLFPRWQTGDQKLWKEN